MLMNSVTLIPYSRVVIVAMGEQASASEREKRTNEGIVKARSARKGVVSKIVGKEYAIGAVDAEGVGVNDGDA